MPWNEIGTVATPHLLKFFHTVPRSADNGSTADRAAKLEAHKATLVERTGFAESDPRIEQGALFRYGSFTCADG